MTVLLVLMLMSFAVSLFYLPAKLIEDSKARRIGWAAMGGMTLLNVVFQLLFVLTFGLGMGKL